ncbi:MAG TPA: energy-coupling factor ABC transporter permease [Candidatus Methanomethylophilaceae archaeon]|nr:energy-coupling factor ABC transporter permease [Candidatus Methanomethylophilaceae archaeon]
MHIMEGFLPWEWCLLWFVLALPLAFYGIKKTIEIIRDNPEQKMIVALSGAFIFLMSSLKLPSVSGSSSHPTGTGLSAVLYGVACTAFLSTIVLIFQALLLAHGGLTTMGANILSMGIVGPFFGILIWLLLRRLNLSVPISMFFAAFVANLMTYVMTSIQLTLAFGGVAGYYTAFIEFMSVFAVTQIPLAIVEGIVFAMFAKYLADSRPHIFGLEDNEPEAVVS